MQYTLLSLQGVRKNDAELVNEKIIGILNKPGKPADKSFILEASAQ